MKKFVFVYGTLQRGQGNHSVMEMSEGHYIGPAETVDRYPLTVNSLPYLHNFAGTGNHVQGEVFEVDTLTHLDRLESHPHFYKREVIPIALATYRLPCWTYFVNHGRRNSELDFKEDEMHSSFREGKLAMSY